MSKLLLDSQPLVVIPELAVAIGLNETIILQQIHYWLEIKKKSDRKGTEQIEGQYWIYNTYDEWKEQFPFWSVDTIKRTIRKLEKMEIIHSKNMNRKNYDNTKWYSINYHKLNKLIDEKKVKEKEENLYLEKPKKTFETIDMTEQGKMPHSMNKEFKDLHKTPQTIDMTEQGKMPYSSKAKCPVHTGQNAPTNTREYNREYNRDSTTTESNKNLSNNTEEKPEVVVEEPKLEINNEIIVEIQGIALAENVALTNKNIKKLYVIADGDIQQVKNGLLSAIQYSKNNKVGDMWALIKKSVETGKIPAVVLSVQNTEELRRKEEKYRDVYMN